MRTGKFRESVDGGGKDLKPGQYAEYWEAPIRQAKAAVLAYSLTKDSTALELADRVIMRLTPEMGFNTIIIRSLISDEVEARSCALSTAIDLYEVTGEKKYLDKAMTLADDAVTEIPLPRTLCQQHAIVSRGRQERAHESL